MRLPFLEKTTKKLTKTATEEVKKEVKKTALDLLPGILAIGTMILGFVLFHETSGSDDGEQSIPYKSVTHITTNNYFLGNAGEEVIKKILEVDDDE